MTQIYGFYTPGNDSMLPIVKINCQDGRIWRVDRSQNSSGAWESMDVDITRVIKFVPDFTNLEIGFIRYADPGVDFQLQTFDAWVEAGRPRKPPEGYKFGFRLPVLLAKECQREENDVRLLSHTSAGVLKAISKIFADWQQRRDNGVPRLPVLTLARFEKKQQGQFRNFEPEFAAGAWINRPEIFDEKLVPLSEEPDAQDAPEDQDNLPF